MSDRQLRQDVLDELDFEPRVNAAHIGVTAEKGVVTLSGHVSSYLEKLAAEKATRRVKGVQAIAQEIEVRYASEKKTADDEIARRAIDILRWSATVPENSVQLKVHDGWVTLSGALDWQFQKDAAEEEVRRLSGVSGIVNSITIRPRVQPVDVKRKIDDAFRRSAEFDAQKVRVSVVGGTVLLEGSVRDWRERDAAEGAAWAAPGVAFVEDRLSIV